MLHVKRMTEMRKLRRGIFVHGGHLFENPEDDADLFEKMEIDLLAA